MSRPINESLQLLNETLGNCKTALTEKQVTEIDNIKISDVDEKITEIQAGGGGGLKFLENVQLHNKPVTNSSFYSVPIFGQDDTTQTIKFTPKEDGVMIVVGHGSWWEFAPELELDTGYGTALTKGVEYTGTATLHRGCSCLAFTKYGDDGLYMNQTIEDADILVINVEG